jgi:hypothetical protein
VGFFVRRRETSSLDFADEYEKAKTSGTDVFKGLWVRPMRKGCCEATIQKRPNPSKNTHLHF